ncbi:hypothetical protein DTO166G4_8494 [Paecilomyces variotii]|nr:hypothetical protein DTO164E3_2287 [Paecilomyces variotii]KAJ9209881.1 hypothetical protein DTO166G4_8494 [Paecilomyces variotii]KAJ9225839.1 hypothetical protein DTO169C6_1902 [Paecilomyces variotii]KAJ9229122.1 hypothetical protein DTO166G5_8128 [Paecilomyces variotii]KAJ9239749.1 hypothetical protein DTO169E5_4261 [Paecilomyces variotii]
MPLQDIPEMILLCREKKFITAFNDALPKYWPSYSTTNSTTTSTPPIQITILNESLNTIPQGTKFDLIVSPANSYGRLDGAFDDAISRKFCLSQKQPYDMLTHAAQRVLYEKWRGFAPPGTCTLVPFPDELKGNEFGCAWIGLCPTMRLPTNVKWDKEVVYECVWSLMGVVEGWNRDHDHNRRSSGGEKIERILITPLATGVGKVSPEKWAAQFVLAMKHFVDALERPERWSKLDWGQIGDTAMEVERTWNL